jgi:hypothetical protein
MLEYIILILIGMFIGWNIPQPAYAKRIQDWVLSIIKRDKE